MVDLPEADVVGVVGVVVDGVGVAPALVRNDALAAGLAPAVLRAPGRDVEHAAGGAADAGAALARGTVAAARVGQAEDGQQQQDEHSHYSHS